MLTGCARFFQIGTGGTLGGDTLAAVFRNTPPPHPRHVRRDHALCRIRRPAPRPNKSRYQVSQRGTL